MEGVIHLKDLTIDYENPKEGVIQLMKSVRPNWMQEDINIKVIIIV